MTSDKALRNRIQKALAIDYLRNEMRILGAASVVPIDQRIQGAASLRRFAGAKLAMQGGSPTDSGGLSEGRVGQRKA